MPDADTAWAGSDLALSGVDFERDATDPRIAWLTLRNPGKHNAISVAMWQRLRELASGWDALRPALAAIVIRGEGGVFAAGGDIEEFPAFRFEPASLRHFHEGIVAPALRALLASDVPLVAQIEAACVGGGLEIAACCDLRIAQSGSRFGAPIAKLGFPMAPDELQLVMAAAGRDLAAEFLLEARLIDADEALRRGLVQRVVADASAEATATARRIAALPVAAARANKRAMRPSRVSVAVPSEAERTEHYSYASSATHREGIAAFIERRAPSFPIDDLP